MPTATLILPFTVPIGEQVKALTPSMEATAVMFLAETKRRKRGLLGTTDKKILSISKLHYPLWAIPWDNESLILDGLNMLSSTTSYSKFPDFDAFLDDIESGKTGREQFRKALEKHESAFRDLEKADKVQLNSLIGGAELLSAILEYVQQTLAQKSPEKDVVVLTPLKLDQTTAIENAKLVTRLHTQIQSEISALEYALKLLEETAQFHEQMISKETEYVKDTYEVEISRIRPSIEKRLDQLEKERDVRIAKMNRITENDLKNKEKERERRENELQKLELNKANYLRRLEARKRRQDKVGATQWEHRVKVDENRIAEAKSRIRSLTEFIEKERKQNQSDIEKLRLAYQTLIDREKRRISEIEFQRDEKIEAKQREIHLLQGKTGEIASQIDRLLARKREQETELKKLAVPHHFDDATLICLPFYLVCYQVGKIAQFEVFPPVKLISSAGIVKTLQKTIRNLRPSSGFAAFSQPMGKTLSKMLSSVIVERMKSEKEFNENLMKAASSSNILERLDLKETLNKGMEELKAVGWISPRQGDALLKTYTQQ